MIVLLMNRSDPTDKEFITDAACVVLNDAPNSFRICWVDGREDRWVNMQVYGVTVVSV